MPSDFLSGFLAAFSLVSCLRWKRNNMGRKGETAEVWMGKGRARIFEYFVKLEKSMVWSGWQLLSKTHHSGMSKVREEGIPGKVWPGLGGPALNDLPGWAAAPFMLKACWVVHLCFMLQWSCANTPKFFAFVTVYVAQQEELILLFQSRWSAG